ncbi:alpha-amylase family glycosyl hydrolase [Proteiniphilum sp.]|uniref:alpha-amylase family glycosyl hydrolase n=1 Tax=Proteiniphilum sp. TaxID=1926877 RepID=UPI00331A49D5
MPIFSKTYYWLLILLLTFSCGDDPVDTPEPPVVIKQGLSWGLEEADADKELTIWFKAASGSPLYNYTGDVYIHTGVISEGEWQFVPAEWSENLSKCKMTKVEGEQSTWSIKLTPSIRQWYGSGKTAVNRLGVVIRSADGSKQTEDFFISVTDTQFKAFEPAAVKNEVMPSDLLHGINIVDNSTVTLVLHDKDKNGTRKDFAHVVGDFNGWTLSNDEKSQMFRDEEAGCWWITISGLNPTKEYAFQYYVGKKDDAPIRVADPYARKILDPSNDKYISSTTYPGNMIYPERGIGIVSVFQTQPESYTWQIPNFETPSRDNLVIYEMLLRDFTESGDINGAMKKLDYLQSLGVNAIELMPVQEFDGNDSWGYNPAFFFALDKAYGTDRMYKEFIDECHKRGMAVILDVVYNHATGENPFARMWWDSANNRTATNNPYFNVTAPHPYSVFHDFNHESELVRNFVKRNLQFLLEEYKIDGFRFDLTKGFTQKQSSESNAHLYDASRIAILKDYNNAVKAVKPDAYVILEHFCDDMEETELGNEGMMVWGNMNHAYCQTAMGYTDGSNFSNTYYNTYFDSSLRLLPRPANSLVSYMESHDEERAAYKQTQWGKGILATSSDAQMSQLATNAAFFFTVPGPKMIWQFGELGYDISIEEYGRTGKKPVKWEYAEVSQRKKLYDTYAQLIKLRFDHPELFTATANLDWKVEPSIWHIGRYINLSSFGGAKQVVVIGNFTNDPITTSAEFPGIGTWYNYMNPGETISVTSATMNITVPANSFKMYTNFAE